MKILVTGGAGYIGSVVVERLLACGHQPVVYDNLSTGNAAAVPVNLPFLIAELSDAQTLKEALLTYQIEAVIHLAASALVGESMTNPALYFRNNVVAGLHLLDAMIECEVTRLVFSSTCAIYGEPEVIPITEETKKRPTNAYGESKLMFENALRWYDTAYGLKSVSLRYFNASGATERLGEHRAVETHLIPIVLQCALGQRKVLQVFGDDYPTPDGTCIRDYIHVSDIADAHILALAQLERGSAAYNLGSGDGHSVKEVITAAQRITGRTIPINTSPRRAGDPAVLVASPERIRCELNWRPQYSQLDTIIESAWNWHRTHPRGYAR